MSKRDSNTSTTALRALHVMETLGNSGRPLSVAEVAVGIRADRSTAYRMLLTLLNAGYVIRDARQKKYQLGYRLLSLTRSIIGADQKTGLIADALRQISIQTKETVHYCVLDRDATVLVQLSKGTQLVAVDFEIGDRAPLHCTSIGKVLLAYQDLKAVEEAISRGLTQVAVNTITEATRFRTELETIRLQGFAFDDREFHNDMRCVAVPIFERGGIVQSGISLSGPSSRYTLEKLEELRVCASEVSRELSRKLGGLN